MHDCNIFIDFPYAEECVFSCSGILTAWGLNECLIFTGEVERFQEQRYWSL